MKNSIKTVFNNDQCCPAGHGVCTGISQSRPVFQGWKIVSSFLKGNLSFHWDDPEGGGGEGGGRRVQDGEHMYTN